MFISKILKKILFVFYFFIIIFFKINYSLEADLSVNFQFNGKRLDDLIQEIANIKGINILVAPGLKELECIVNFSLPDKVPLYEVEEYLIHFLSMAGFVLTYQDGTFIINKRAPELLQRYSIPLYVDIPPENLPNNPGLIRVMYFLKHLRVPSDKNPHVITDLLLKLLPDAEKACIVDPKSNSLVITGPSNVIASIMTIILELDKYGIRDELAILPIKNVSAENVHKLLEDILNIAKDSVKDSNGKVSSNYSGLTYFSPQIKIILDKNINSLIFLGKKEAIDKIINFVIEEIDIPQISDKTFIYIYNLKYLDAEEIKKTLQSVVNKKVGSGGGEQSVSGGTSFIYRNFDSVRILGEEKVPLVNKDDKPTKLKLGGNRLLISATEDDYKEIVKLIEILDRPQPQIIIEVMILDLEVNETNSFSSQFRIPSIFNLPEGASMQSVMLDNSSLIINTPGKPGAVTNGADITANSTLKSNLVESFTKGDSGGKSDNMVSLANNVPRTGMLISLGEHFRNQSIATILNLSQTISKKNIIESPCVITQNNTTAVIKSVNIRRSTAEISDSNTQYTATVINIKGYPAELGVNITPRITYGNLDNNSPIQLNLEIQMSIEDFKSSEQSNVNKIARSIKTNAIVNSGDLLILGGLYKQSNLSSKAKTPILADIPLLGMFFRKNEAEDDDTNLVMIIRATVADEHIVRNFTCFKDSFIKSELNELALSGMRDPITRFYFNRDFIDYADDKDLCKKNEIEKNKDKEIEEKNKIINEDLNKNIVDYNLKNENYKKDKKSLELLV